jgi:hypothetical protein
MSAADTICRYPLTVPDDKDVQLHQDLEIKSLMMTTVVSNDIAIAPSKLHEHAAEGEEYQYLLTIIQTYGFAKSNKQWRF